MHPVQTRLSSGSLLIAALVTSQSFAAVEPRHNIGKWPVRQVQTDAPSGTRAFHSAKDREMSRLAGTGFVIWDGASQGSRANIRHLCERGRCIDVFLRAGNRFAALSTDAERMAFLTSGRLG